MRRLGRRGGNYTTGGSNKDEESIAAANEHGIAMVFTDSGTSGINFPVTVHRAKVNGLILLLK